QYLAFIGSSPGTEEDSLTMDQLIQRFRIEKIQPTPAMSNRERLKWLNGQFIRRLSPDELAGRLTSRMPDVSVQALRTLMPLVQERLRTLNEAPEMLRFFFAAPEAYRPEQLMPKGGDAAGGGAALENARSPLATLPDWTP